jgi:allantoicase
LGADHSTASLTPPYTALADLASARLGGKALAANDEFFAPKANLLKPEAPIFVADKFTARGKWMDGWETRRRRTQGHDWCVIALGVRGVVRGINVDTSHFTGNYPSHCSIEAIDSERPPSPSTMAAEGAPWVTLVPRTALRGDSSNFLPVASDVAWTHVRLNIFPDGGVARLRVYGDVTVDWTKAARSRRAMDMASIKNGGLVIGASDMHFGAKDNMIAPGRAANISDGWETRRRRGPGYDWAIVRLGAPAILSKIEVDTNHFKGNYPESASLEGSLVSSSSLVELGSASWTTIIHRTPLKPHFQHYFTYEIAHPGPFSHVRLNIYPDGGISRLRVHGHVADD